MNRLLTLVLLGALAIIAAGCAQNEPTKPDPDAVRREAEKLKAHIEKELQNK